MAGDSSHVDPDPDWERSLPARKKKTKTGATWLDEQTGRNGPAYSSYEKRRWLISPNRRESTVNQLRSEKFCNITEGVAGF